MTYFAIRTGCELIINKPYFKGSWRKPKLDGVSTLKVKVLRHSYGAQAGQHTFTCEVIEVIDCGSDQTHCVGQSFRIKGRNLYPIVDDHIQGEESREASKS